MRDQYKVLSEKYEQIQEGEADLEIKHTPITRPRYASADVYIKMLKSLMKAETFEQAKQIVKESSKSGKYVMSRSLLIKTLKQVVDPLGIDKHPEDPFTRYGDPNYVSTYGASFLYSTIVFIYDGMIAEMKGADRGAQNNYFVAEKRWNQWRAAYVPYKKALHGLEQKNKETGINLDI